MHNDIWSRRRALRAAAAAASSIWLPSKAQDGDEIRIGQSAHLSGPLAPTLAMALRGQSLALDEINRSGGIGGRPVRLIALDDGYDAKRCLDNVDSLIRRDKVIALTGLASTANVAAVLPVLAQKRVPLIGVYTGAPAVRAAFHPFFFTSTASYRDEVVQMVRNLATLRMNRIGLVYQNNAFGQGMLAVIEEVVAAHAAQLVGKQALDITGRDAAEVAQVLSVSAPQAVLLIGFGPSIASFVKAARTRLGVPMYALATSNTKSVLAALGDDARGLAFTQIVPYPWRRTTALTRDFGAAMERANLPIGYDSFWGYLNMRVVLAALQRAGRQATSDSVVKAMESMGRLDLGGYTLSYGPQNHHGSSFVEITIVGPDGRYLR